LEFKQDLESKTLKLFGVGEYSAEARAESESKISDSVNLWCMYVSVEHDPVSGSLSNRILLFRTRDEHGSGLDRTGSGLMPILAASGLDRTAIFLKIVGSGLDRTEKKNVLM